MKHLGLILLAIFGAAIASAQTPAKPASTAATTTTTEKTTATTPPWIKLPPNVPHVAHGVVKVAFSLRYEDLKIGTGAEAEPGKLYTVDYTGWRAADGVKFDSSFDHRMPVRDKDGKPEMGPDGKPKLGDPQPFKFAQGAGPGRGPFPGFDEGFAGMKVGGKRRLFIPWQIAYGTHAIPDRPDHPGIPAKSDLIFDVELVEVSDVPAPQRPPFPGRPPVPPGAHPGTPGAPAAPAAPAAPGTAPGAGGAIHPAPGAAAPPANAAPPAAPATPPQPGTPPATANPPQPAAPQTTAPPQTTTPPQPSTPQSSTPPQTR
jgi:peptidylprolyl isomerase